MNHQALHRPIYALFVCSLLCLEIAHAAPNKVVPRASTPKQSTAAVAVRLAQNGKALLPIVVAHDASPRVQEAAKTLSAYLKRISGGEFKVELRGVSEIPSTRGITIGLVSQFPALARTFKADDPTQSEDYILRSHANGVLLAGMSELAVEHAVWDFLYRLGYRQFFPGEKWEVVPGEKNLRLAVNAVERPDYYARSIWPGYGYLPENRPGYEIWNARNRATSGIVLNTGHAYDAIISRNKAEFEKHPEYLTKPGGNKFFVSNPGLRQLVIADALAQFAKNPQLQSVSLDPSDGGNWDSDACPDAQVYKSVTDRVITLANEVAEAVNQKYPGKMIGVYAYNEHSPPPTIAVHPNVVVSVATAFIRGGYTIDELIAGWSAKAKVLGIREYYSVNVWDRDLPGQTRGGNIEYLKTTIPNFQKMGARFLSAEASDNWGPNGLGYYIAARLMWDGDEANRVEAITKDFIEKAFGPAREPMSEYYRLIDGSHRPLLSTDLMGRMYRRLGEAFQKTNDPAVRARLHDLGLYTRYVELYSKYAQSTGDERQAAFEALMRYAWRIRGTRMIHTLALWRDLPARDKQVKFLEGVSFQSPEGEANWKSSEPFTAEQMQKIIADGIANNPIISFKAAAYSKNLVPATPLQLSSKARGSFNLIRGSQDFYTWVEKAPATITLQTRAGLIYTNLGAADINLYPSAETFGASVARTEVAPDKEMREIQLKTTFQGLHRINVSDQSAGTQVSWPEGMPMTVESSLQSPVRFTAGRWSMYFYVPKGTTVVGGYINGVGHLLDADGKVAKKFEAPDNQSYWNVPVAPGQDGKLWMLQGIAGQAMLMTVPPYLARSADELLLPVEVIKSDTVK